MQIIASHLSCKYCSIQVASIAGQVTGTVVMLTDYPLVPAGQWRRALGEVIS